MQIGLAEQNGVVNRKTDVFGTSRTKVDRVGNTLQPLGRDRKHRAAIDSVSIEPFDRRVAALGFSVFEIRGRLTSLHPNRLKNHR